jgi:hypothetical protein
LYFSFGSVWSRSGPEGAGQPLIFQPDGIDITLRNHSSRTEYGRIVIDVSSGSSLTHTYDPAHVLVTDDEVFLNITLIKDSTLTLHAIRRFQIESHDTLVTTVLTPMQPNSQRSKPAQPGFGFVGRAIPVDFACMEIDVSSMRIGTHLVSNCFQIHF